MAIDPNRALLLNSEYRYVTAAGTNPATLILRPGAVDYKIDTNLDKASAQALADAFMAQMGVTKDSAFTFTCEFILYPDDFITAPPRFSLTFKRHPVAAGMTYTVTTAKPSFQTGTTSVTVRAS